MEKVKTIKLINSEFAENVLKINNVCFQLNLAQLTELGKQIDNSLSVPIEKLKLENVFTIDDQVYGSVNKKLFILGKSDDYEKWYSRIGQEWSKLVRLYPISTIDV